MAISGAVDEAGTPLLAVTTVDGSVDYRSKPAVRSSSGGWRSAGFIIGVEVAERFAYYGISSNLITYLTGPLGQSTAAAAANVNAWSGTASLLPLLGAFIADSFLGRFRTILAASALYILGLGLLTLSAMIPSDCNAYNLLSSCSPRFQVIMFFSALYLVALAQGGHKPCVQAFGADQFDEKDPEERKQKTSFFNWWYFGMCFGTLVTLWVLNYIQDNLSWALGFGIPCIAMVVALIIFVLGTRAYRFSIRREGQSPFARIGNVYVAAVKNWGVSASAVADAEERFGLVSHKRSQQFSFLNKALVSSNGSCSVDELEEAKSVLRLAPIWFTCLVYAVVFAQSPTFFTKQGATMERSITPSYKISPATLQSFISLSIVIFVPIYDRVLIPIARSFTHKPGGITMLQRIGTGLFLSFLAMVIAALVEMKRLKTAADYGLVDSPDATVPMSVWWLVPQYVLFGISDVFAMVGLQEFFYDQVPSELRSVGLALYLSIFGIGNFLSSFVISVIEKATSQSGQVSWFANNLNQAHLDYFYWLLACLSFIGLASYMYFAKSYVSKRLNAL
ncbi:PREDICTED: protein NRT1/ PTR FAMILY 5.10 [Camelina sativa]|uniref:Protein NRT1/ PTR FAMILY 5.10 n=1 Tax=Camelina sativa TaxID=90675 RepID=A0ABM0YBZ8_CAMSA|nr:PREDICTED: protein NRT1/ PTR FAMILY 5.10 [Camelina sativa]XP_010498729.1 PREDICTED: protein NRT1/ PTR FAMILY 5.10 [Camelina sativa]